MTVEDDDGDLPDHAGGLVGRFDRVRSRVVFGRVGHDQHWISGVLEPLVVGREQLSAVDFDREVAAGRVRDIETAIEEALATPLPRIVPSP